VFSSRQYGHPKADTNGFRLPTGTGQKGYGRGTLEGNRVRTVDGNVRAKHASVTLAGVGSSHTLHSVSPASTGNTVLKEAPLSRRERLIEATVQVVSEGSVDRLQHSRHATKAL
jgi:hypothetical protein